MANELRVLAAGVQGTLGTPLGTTDTALSSACLSALPVVDTTSHAPLTLWAPSSAGPPAFEIVYVTAHTAGSTTATILRAQEGTVAQPWPTGTTVTHGATRRNFPKTAQAKRTAGDLTTTSTSYVDVDTSLDLTVAAYAGDVLDVGLGAPASNSVASALTAFDAFTLVNGAVVTSVSGAVDGVSAWRGQAMSANEIVPRAGTQQYTVLPADITAGTPSRVTLRLRWKVSSGTGTFYADGNNRIPQFYVRNNGPREALV